MSTCLTRCPSPALAALAVSLCLPATTGAGTPQYWNPGGIGGDGIWGSGPGEKNWNTIPGAPAGNVTWPGTGDEIATFQDAIGGIVTVFEPVIAAGLVQDNANYTINAGTITLVPDASGAVPFINVNSGTLTIDSVLDGADGLIKNGGGDLVLSTGNTYTGPTDVQSGTLTLTGSLASSTIDIAEAGALVNQSGGFSDTTALTNRGQLTVHADDTVATYLQTGILSGAGSLTVTGGATLDGGTSGSALVNGTLLGNTTTTGRVMISGTSGGGALTIRDGELQLEGMANNTLIDIQDGILRIMGSGDQISDSATVSVGSGAELQILGSGRNEVVGQASIAGRIFDAGTLTATTYSLLDGAVIDSHLGEGHFDKADAGTVTINGSVRSDAIVIPQGTLILSGNNLEDTADVALTTGGTLHLRGNETVRSFNSLGGTLSGEAILLTTDGASLNHGSTVSAALAGDTTSNGDVLISGRTILGHLAIESGTLTATGDLANETITIDPGAALHQQGFFLPEATLTNNGTLTNDVDTEIATYTQTPGSLLNGPGTLTATSALNGGEMAGSLGGEVSIDGDVLVSGSLIGSPGGTHLRINSGTLTLTGSAANGKINLESGASIVNRGDIGISSLENSGTLINTLDDTIGGYYQDGSGRLEGSGTLSVEHVVRLSGGEVAGHLVGKTGIRGDTLISGTAGGEKLTVGEEPTRYYHATLTNTGTLNYDNITILERSTLLNRGNLADTAAITNSGTLQVDTNDNVGTYTANGGLLSGTGRLTAINGATLNDGSEVSGILAGNTTTAGDVLISGTLIGRLAMNLPNAASQATTPPRSARGISPISPSLDALDVTAGTLTVAGHAYRTPITIYQDATILDQSQDAFHDGAQLTNHGRLILDGHETVESYHSSPTGNLQLKVTGSTALDHLTADTVTLDPGSSLILERTELLLGQMADIIDGAVDGTFAMIDALAGVGKDLRYSFNPNDGTIQALPGAPVPSPTPSNTLYNLSADQTQLIGTVFDATHLGPVPNFRRRYFRDTGNPDPALRWQEITLAQARPGDTAIYDLDPGLGRAPVAPGTQAALLGDAIATFQSSFDPASDPTRPMVTAQGFATANALSSESHQGMADFTRHALRTQMRTAMRTPNGANAGKGHVFATFHTGSAGASAPTDGASYNLDLGGGVAGVRYHLSPDLRIGAMLGTVDGDITGPHIHTDAHGFSIGLFGEYLLDDASQTTAFASLGLGTYSYDATRQSFGGPVYANNIDSSAIELALGIETIAWQSERFRLLPRAAFRYLDGEVDGFTETGPGVQMHIASLDTQSLLFELGVDAEYDLNERTTLNAHLGVLTDLLGSGESVSGTYVGGGLPVSVQAPGIDSEALILGLGASLDLNATASLDLNWRSEFRDDSQHTHLLTLGARATF